jgi:Phenylalanyl-tRNA synthetase alpha subunit
MYVLRWLVSPSPRRFWDPHGANTDWQLTATRLLAMRLLATGRALRASSGRWSVAITRPMNRASRLHAIRETIPAATRNWSSTAALRVADQKPSTGSPSSQSNLKIEAKTTQPINGPTHPTQFFHISADDSTLTKTTLSPLPASSLRASFPLQSSVITPRKIPLLRPDKISTSWAFRRTIPGRSRTDTYYVNDKTVLRTHTSAHQQAYFQQINRNEKIRPEEVGYTVIADVYRRDAIDRSHYPVSTRWKCDALEAAGQQPDLRPPQ